MEFRYAVTRLPGGSWGIFDKRLGALCSLAGVRLEWGRQTDAEGWLYRCRVAWRAELVAVPAGWNHR